MYNLPKSWFKDTVQYIVENGNNDGWDVGTVEMGKSIAEVQNVRISANIGLNKGYRDNTDVATAILYVHPAYSSFTAFEKGNKVSFNGQEYTISRIFPYTQPTSSQIHHWRLELI